VNQERDPSVPPRIAPIVHPDEAQREALSKVPLRPDGEPRNIFLTFAHHPMLLKRFNAFAGTFMRFGLLSPYERELAILRVAGRLGSRYEFAQHLAIARDAGLDDSTIAAVLQQPGSAALTAADRLIACAADEMLAGDITEETWTALAARYEQPALLELLFTIAFYRMIGDLLRTIRVEVEEEPDLAIDWSYAAGPVSIVTTPAA